MSSYQPGDGALAGDYTITVVPAPADPKVIAKEAPRTDKLEIPKKYADPKTSGLKETIKAGEPKKDLKLELKE